MKVLLDECLPKRLTRALAPHDAKLAQQAGWSGIKNGRLLALAAPLYDVLVTIDQELEYQQNLNTLPIAIVVLRARSNRFADVAPLVPDLLAVLRQLVPRKLVHVGP
jgi:predicted nuclease of predicted toxin-antitoxin system